jgi:hypothetical protein
VWLVRADGTACFAGEGRLVAVAACSDVVIVEQFVVAGTELNEVVELGLASTLERGDVVCLEFAGGGAAGVLTVA